MLNFRKVFSLEVFFPVIALIVLLDSNGYCGGLSCLRAPLITSDKKIVNIWPYDRKHFYRDGEYVSMKDGTIIFVPKNPSRRIDEEEAERVVDHVRRHGGQARLMVQDNAMMTYITGDVLTHIMDAAQFSFNIGLATGGTTEALRKLLGLSEMLYNTYGRAIDADKIDRICTLDNYYFNIYLKEKGYTEEDSERILQISSYESEQLYMMIENLIGGKENVKAGRFTAPRGRTNLDWFSEAARFRRLVIQYFCHQNMLWQLHGIGSNSHDAFNEVYTRLVREIDSNLTNIGLELYKDRQVKQAILKDGTRLTKFGIGRIPPFKKIPLEFTRMGGMRPTHGTLIAFIIQVQNASHFIPRDFHPFFLKFMGDNSLYDVDELVAAILASTEEELCKYSSDPKYHFRDMQHFVDELNYLFEHYSDVPEQAITWGTADLLEMGSRPLPDGNYPLQVFMASSAHKQIGVMRALQPPSVWSTASEVLNKAKAALLAATQEAMEKVKDLKTRNTFFSVEPQGQGVKSFGEDRIQDRWSLTLSGKSHQLETGL